MNTSLHHGMQHNVLSLEVLHKIDENNLLIQTVFQSLKSKMVSAQEVLIQVMTLKKRCCQEKTHH